MDTLPAHQYFCDLLEQTTAQMAAGDPAWKDTLARTRRIAEEVPDGYRADVAVRLHRIDGWVAMHSGDRRTARTHADAALEILRRYQELTGESVEVTAPMEFLLLGDLVRTQILDGDLDDATTTLRTMEELAPYALDPSAVAKVRNLEGDVMFHRHDYGAARALYGEAVELSRPFPDLLGSALVGLATAQAFAGDVDAAETTAARARPLVDEPNDLASLHEVDLQIARVRMDGDAMERAYADYRALVEERGEFLRPEQRAEAAVGGVFEAQKSGDFESAVALLREIGETDTDDSRAISLLRTAHATWFAGRHGEAFSLLDAAADSLDGSPYLVLRASIDVQRAQYLCLLPHLDIPLVQEVLPRVQAAAIVLRHLSFQVDTAAARREFVVNLSREAVEMSCHLAFTIGDNRQVAEMVDLVAAAPAVRVAGPSLLVSAPPRAAGLAEAYGIVEKRYGLRV